MNVIHRLADRFIGSRLHLCIAISGIVAGSIVFCVETYYRLHP